MAAQAYVQTDLMSAVQHTSQTVQVAVSKFSLENGYLIFPDRVITPAGKVIENKANNRIRGDYPQLNSAIKASKQKEALRTICHYLLDNGYAKKSGRTNRKPIPLFKKASYTNRDDKMESIDANTGGRLLQDGDISDTKAQVLMNWLQKKFSWVFS